MSATVAPPDTSHTSTPGSTTMTRQEFTLAISRSVLMLALLLLVAAGVVAEPRSGPGTPGWAAVTLAPGASDVS